jgi:uncharacterized protein (TIGR02246 family)
MNSLAKTMLLVAGSLAITACGKTVSNTSADTSAIRSSQDAWYKGYNSSDVAAVAALYADDAVLMAPNVPAASGIAAIREYYSNVAPAFQAAGLTAEEGSIGDVGISGDLAWQGTTYTITDKSGATVDAGKVLTVFQRRNGKWMIIRDTWNSDAPPASSATGAASALAALAASAVALAKEQTAPQADSSARTSEADKQTLTRDCMRQVHAAHVSMPDKDVKAYCEKQVKSKGQPVTPPQVRPGTLTHPRSN